MTDRRQQGRLGDGGMACGAGLEQQLRRAPEAAGSQQLAHHVLDDTALYVDATVGVIERVLANGWGVLEEDYRLKGEVWRVHKGGCGPMAGERRAGDLTGPEQRVICSR